MTLRASFAGLSGRFSALPGNVRGVLWTLAAGVAFTVMFALIKQVVTELPVFVATLIRTLAAFVMLLPWLRRVGLAGIHTQRPRGHLLRAILGISSFSCIVLALRDMLMNDTIVITFSSPLWSILILALFFGRKPDTLRTVATVVGFLGVALVVKPQGGLQPAALFALAGALLASSAMITVKNLTATEPPERIVFWFFLFGTLLLLPPALYEWQTPTLAQFGLLVGSGAAGLIGQTWLSRAYAAGDIAVVQPMDFARIPMAAVTGTLFFGEVPDEWSLAGTIVIVGACLYIARR